MTKRFNSLTVVLQRDIREDDAQCILSAIQMIKGVLAVTGNVSDPDTYTAEVRVRREITSKVLDALKETD